MANKTWGRGPFQGMNYWRQYTTAARRFPKATGPLQREQIRQRRRFPLAAERPVERLPTR
jgi:hypothetical protein